MASDVPHPQDLLDLTGRVAIVTGASQGIGAGIATRFATAGARVVVHYRRDRQAAKHVVTTISASRRHGRRDRRRARYAKGRHALLRGSRRPARTGRHPRQQRRAELPAPPARRDLAGRVAGDVPRQPRVDVPVHAGRGGRDARARRRGDREHRLDLGDRTRPATTATTTAARPRSSRSPGRVRRSSGRPASGSILSRRGSSTRPASRRPGPRVSNAGVGRAPLGRLGEPEDIADACLFLASPAARWISGQNLAVDGGVLAARPY